MRVCRLYTYTRFICLLGTVLPDIVERVGGVVDIVEVEEIVGIVCFVVADLVVATVRQRLVELGVDPEHRDGAGETYRDMRNM